MDIQRRSSPRQNAAPNVGSSSETTPTAGAQAPGKPTPPRDSHRAAEADSFKPQASGGEAQARGADPVQQGYSIKEQRRANKSAASAKGGAESQAQPSAAPAAAAPPEFPMLAEVGRVLGLGAGVLVTEALALVPGWNQPLLDENGKPVQSIPGAERIGDHAIEKRHQEVVGPRITEFDEKIPKGALHDLVGGFGAGATEAPGASYRLEVKVEDTLKDLWKKLTGP